VVVPYRTSVNEEWTRGQGPCVKVLGGGPVYLLVEDVAHARRFYEGVLGLPEPENADATRAEYALPDGGRWIVLAREPTVSLDPDASTVRAALVVDDLQGSVNALRARGVVVTDGPRPAAGGRTVAEIRDAQDNRILLISKAAA
jgi:predicted enzyme related to lactoylglutathione lyase